MNANPTNVDDYLSALPDDARGTLSSLRAAIRAAAPDAVEVMGYGMPGFKYKGRPLIYFAAAKKHCALYGVDVDAHRDALAAYDASKGTVRFPPDEPPPEELLKILVSTRIAEIDTNEAARKATKSIARSSS